LLLALASAFILGSGSRGTRDHILLSQIRHFPFCRLLRLPGLRWMYSTLPPHGKSRMNALNNCQRTEERSPPPRVPRLLFMGVFSSKYAWTVEESPRLFV
jgi:hypothetical protein